MNKFHLIMPMCGAGSRFAKLGYKIPKPLIEIKGRPFFYWAVRSVEKFNNNFDIFFVILKDHIEKFAIDKEIVKYFPNAKIIVLPNVTLGPVFTCLKGIEAIKDELPIIINDCDHMFKSISLNKILESYPCELDGAMVTFESLSPNFSYIQYDENNKLVGTVEKKVVSNHAICGAYVFRSAKLFREIADEYVKSCPYCETFISGMYNIMCAKKMKIKDFLLDFHVEFGTPEEYKNAKVSKYFSSIS